ncbi:MAG: AAA family ATPase [Thiogranum sp.]|nr:AAA family ATPase [Thiogranum sp.]
MYEPFYNLTTDAFRLTPDPRFCFAHASHVQAHAYLEYALKLGEGFIMITGRPGTGKTTLIEAFINQIDRESVVAESIAAYSLEATELLRAVAYAYGIDAEGLDKATLRRRIQQFFTTHAQAGRRGLLVIDEAQGLSHAAIEELRLLSDLRSGSSPLLQLFLVGQDSLRDVMRSPDIEQFQQRVVGTCRLEPLDLQDTRGYIEYRLRRAGWNGDPQITGRAIAAVHQNSRGVPRHINKIATRLLLHGFMEHKHELDERDVLLIAAELRDEQLGPMDAQATEPRGKWPPRRADYRVADAPARTEAPAAPDHRAHRSASSGQVNRNSEPPTARAPVQRETTKTDAWHKGLFRKAAAFIVVVLSTAALTTWFGRGSNDHSSVLAVSPEWAEPLAARPDNQEAPASQVFQIWRSEPMPDLVESDNTTNEPQSPAPKPAQKPLARAAMPGAASTLADTATNTNRPPMTEASDDAADTLASKPDSPREPVDQQLSRAPDEASADDAGVALVKPPENAEKAEPKRVASQEDGMTEQSALPLKRETTELAVLTPIAEPQTPALEIRPKPKAEPEPAPDSRDPAAEAAASKKRQEIEKLLNLARQAMQQDRLLIPADNNAHDYYQQVLALDADNNAANDGLEQIVRRYVFFAERALDQHDEAKTRLYIERGLRVQPGNEPLLALQKDLNIWLAKLEAEAQKPVAAPPPPPPQKAAEPAAQKPETFISVLRNFLGVDRRAEADQDNGSGE